MLKAHGPMKQNASPGEQSEAPRRRWNPGHEQHPGPENQDSQHMLNQPRGSFIEEAFLDIQNYYRQTYFEGNFKLRIQNLAARRTHFHDNFHYRYRFGTQSKLIL